MTEQEIFETVVERMVDQGEPSWTPDGGVRYHDYNGNKCAVGCLISEEEYRPEFDTGCMGLHEVLKEVDLWEHREVLRRLQLAHDCAAVVVPVEEWLPEFLSRVEQVAKTFRLEWRGWK